MRPGSDDPGSDDPGSDPILARRSHMAAMARAGKRLGYSLFALAVAVFAVGAAGRFTEALVRIITLSMAVGSAALAPSIVIAYGVRAADREDRRRGLA